MKSLITKPLGKRQREVIEDLRTHGRPTQAAWISLRCKMSESDVNKILSSLIVRGFVRRLWISRTAFYVLTVEGERQ